MKWLAPAGVLAMLATSVVATLRPSTFLFIRRMPLGDKGGHFVVMGLMALALVLGLSPRVGARFSLPVLLCIALALVLVTIEEVVQRSLPTRAFSWMDLAFSYGGILCFGLAGGVIRHFWDAGADHGAS
jgi:VanZ family protein